MDVDLAATGSNAAARAPVEQKRWQAEEEAELQQALWAAAVSHRQQQVRQAQQGQAAAPLPPWALLDTQQQYDAMQLEELEQLGGQMEQVEEDIVVID